MAHPNNVEKLITVSAQYCPCCEGPGGLQSNLRKLVDEHPVRSFNEIMHISPVYFRQLPTEYHLQRYMAIVLEPVGDDLPELVDKWARHKLEYPDILVNAYYWMIQQSHGPVQFAMPDILSRDDRDSFLEYLLQGHENQPLWINECLGNLLNTTSKPWSYWDIRPIFVPHVVEEIFNCLVDMLEEFIQKSESPIDHQHGISWDENENLRASLEQHEHAGFKTALQNLKEQTLPKLLDTMLRNDNYEGQDLATRILKRYIHAGGDLKDASWDICGLAIRHDSKNFLRFLDSVKNMLSNESQQTLSNS